MKRINHRLCAVLMLLWLTIVLLPLSTFAASPPVPRKVTLTSIFAPAANKITIKWKRVANASNYVIYNKKVGASKWIRLATISGSKRSYTHTSSAKYPLTPGKKYTYTVRGYNKSTKKYGRYDSRGLTVALPAPKPSKVTLTSIFARSTNRITIKWKRVANASNYVIYNKRVGSSKWTRLATVAGSKSSYTHTSSAKYPLTPGKKYTYTVRGYNRSTKKYGSYNARGLTTAAAKPQHQHSYEVSQEGRSDCTKPGCWKTYTCSSCGDWYIEDLPLRKNHTWEDLGDMLMSWNNDSNAGQVPISNIKEVTSIIICANCGEFFGDNEHWEQRYMEHTIFNNSSSCQAYTVVTLSAIHHLLGCTHCVKYKCGSFMYYRYPAWPGSGYGKPPVPTVFLRPTEAQIIEMGLSPNG